MRTCRRCRRSRDITEFGYYEGMVRRSRVCKVCYGSEVSKIEKTQAETERIKAIMSVPIKPEATHFHYMGKNPIQREQEIGV